MMEEDKKSWLKRLRSGLDKSRTNFAYQVKTVFKQGKLTDETWDDLEAVLIGSDVGLETTVSMVDDLRKKVKEKGVFDAQGLSLLLKEEMIKRLTDVDRPLDIMSVDTPAIIMMVGVNGTGKTTTIGKLANQFRSSGKSVTLVAADTFRAAAIEQLEKWADRAGVDFIKHERGGDPAAVVFDAMHSTRAKGTDITIIDTAGRLHTYVNLMEELKKVKKVAVREANDIPVYTLIVIDATTGQNGILQAKTFNKDIELDGLVLTKLDGTAKGGIVISVQNELGVPISLIGVGESVDDLRPFEPEEFVAALLD